MAQVEANDSSNDFIDMQPQAMVQVGLLGLGLGVGFWLLTLLIRQVIFVPLFCGDPTNSLCTGATDTAGAIALFLVSIGGLLGLVRLGIYRPLLITIAALISLWGIAGWTRDMFWFEALAWSIFLFAIVYLAFTWLVRPRVFGIALASVVVVVVLARILAVL